MNTSFKLKVTTDFGGKMGVEVRNHTFINDAHARKYRKHMAGMVQRGEVVSCEIGTEKLPMSTPYIPAQ